MFRLPHFGDDNDKCFAYNSGLETDGVCMTHGCLMNEIVILENIFA